MIDINELRSDANTAYFGHMPLEISGSDILELLDRLEAAESARRDDYQNWMTALDRNAELLAKLEAAEKDITLKERLIDALGSELNAVANGRDELQAKIAEMERQEPVTWMQSTHLSSFKNRLCGSQSSYVHCSDHQLHPDFKPLYALPGAKGEEK